MQTRNRDLAMKKQIHHLPVNWIDGMKINKEHFIATDKSVSNQVINTYEAFINPYNYGLILQTSGNTKELNIVIDIDNQKFIHAKVYNCSAVTKGGIRIEIKNDFFSVDELSTAVPQIEVASSELSESEYYLVLAIDTEQRIPYGVANPDEHPPRLPFVLPAYKLSIHSDQNLESIKTDHSLIIGKLLFKDGSLQLDEEYIPPCQTIYSHPKLAEYHAQLVKVLGQIEIDLVSILKRVKEKKQSTTIALTVADVIDSLLLFMSVNLVEFRKMAKFYPPIFIFEQMAAIARIVNNSVNKQATTDREELLNYIEDWSNLKQGEFEELIAQTIEFKYDHDDINKSINHLAPFVNAISKICNTLSNLDFIGKKKDRQIFVKEQKEKPGSSFLVD